MYVQSYKLKIKLNLKQYNIFTYILITKNYLKIYGTKGTSNFVPQKYLFAFEVH